MSLFFQCFLLVSTFCYGVKWRRQGEHDFRKTKTSVLWTPQHIALKPGITTQPAYGTVFLIMFTVVSLFLSAVVFFHKEPGWLKLTDVIEVH